MAIKNHRKNKHRLGVKHVFLFDDNSEFMAVTKGQEILNCYGETTTENMWLALEELKNEGETNE